MNKQFFKPHLGEGFLKPSNNIFGGLKILALGHNHYCNKLLNARRENREVNCGFECPGYTKECQDLTIDVIARFISYCNGNEAFEGFMNTYSNFANALSGYNYTRQDVWNNIAFFNYCQRAVSHDSEQPKAKDYEDSEEPFLNFLFEYKPDVILCWSFDKVYMNTPSEHWTAPNGDELGFYTIVDKKIPMFYIHHPSWAGFSPEKEYESINYRITQIKDTTDSE